LRCKVQNKVSSEQNYTLNGLKLDLPFYIRYVDDIALAVPTDKIDTILDMFNSYHNILQFTIEYEINRIYLVYT